MRTPTLRSVIGLARSLPAAAAFVALLFTAACGGSDSGSNGGAPKLIQFPDGSLSEIEKEKQAQEKFELQKKLLRKSGHEIEYFDNDALDSALGVRVIEHETVQLIYFNYEDDIVGFCSGAWLSNDFVATAGHCHADEYRFDIKEGESCDGKVVFAYRASPSTETEYFRCSTTLRTEFDVVWGEELEQGSASKVYDISDHAYFSVKPSGDMRSFNSSTLYTAERVLASEASRASTMGGDFYLLAVDPPNRYDDLSSQYDLVAGQRKDISTSTELYNMSVVERSFNEPESGNSGGPVYYKFSDPDFSDSELRVSGGMAWAFPLYGRIFGNSKVTSGSIIGESISRIQYNLSFVLQSP